MSVYFRYFPNENASENFKGMDATKSMDREEGEEEKGRKEGKKKGREGGAQSAWVCAGWHPCLMCSDDGRVPVHASPCGWICRPKTTRGPRLLQLQRRAPSSAREERARAACAAQPRWRPALRSRADGQS